MIKALFISALLYCASTQDVQGVLNQAGDVAAQANVAAPSTQDVQSLLNQIAVDAAPYADRVQNNVGDNVVITLGEYEWVLAENGEGEVDLSVFGVPGNQNNVASSIAGLLTAAGVSLQDNADAINNAGNSRVGDAGVVLNNNNAIGQAADQYGAQLQNSADSLSPSLADAYNQAGAQLAANQDGVADQVNQQINQALTNGVNVQDVQNTASQVLSNLPADTVNNLNNAASQAADQAAGVAGNFAASIDPVQSADALSNVADTSVSDIANAANNAVNNGLDQAANAVGGNVVPTNVDVSGAVNNAADAAASNQAVNNAVTNAVNNAVDSALNGNFRGGR